MKMIWSGFTSETCGFFYGMLTVSAKQYHSILKYS